MDTAVADCVETARAELQAAKRALTLAIRSYPQPVDEDDVEFHALLAERRRIKMALGALSAEVTLPFSLGGMHKAAQGYAL